MYTHFWGISEKTMAGKDGILNGGISHEREVNVQRCVASSIEGSYLFLFTTVSV